MNQQYRLAAGIRVVENAGFAVLDPQNSVRYANASLPRPSYVGFTCSWPSSYFLSYVDFHLLSYIMLVIVL